MNSNSSWHQPEQNFEGPVIEVPKWYNNKLYLFLSICVLPVFLYGMYKTDLLDKNKKIAAGFIVTIIFIGAYSGDGSSSGGVGQLNQSAWDNSVPVVKTYIKKRLNDPGSYESIDWNKASKNSDGTYTVTHTYSAKNGFGGRVTHTASFKIDKDGKTVISVMDF